jgi:hypothetical protein
MIYIYIYIYIILLVSFFSITINAQEISENKNVEIIFNKNPIARIHTQR